MTRFNAAFWRWFGNSRVVDANGEPLVVYHGSPGFEAITEFRPTPSKRTMGFLGAEREVVSPSSFFSESIYMASAFGENRSDYGRGSTITRAFLSIQNPIDLTGERRRVLRQLRDAGIETKEAKRSLWEILDDPVNVEKLKAAGYDGAKVSDASAAREFGRNVIGRDPFAAPEAAKTWAAFSPEQIKSVYNQGTWDPGDADIRRNPKTPARIGVTLRGTVIADGKEVDPTSVIARQAIERLRVRIIEAARRGDRAAIQGLRQQVQDREAAAEAWGGRHRQAKLPTGNINFERLAEMGFTNDVREAGYVTPEGRLIDLSGKREGGPAGTRSYDHREAGGVPGMQEFMAQGNIRMDFGQFLQRGSSASINIAKEPTPAQYDVLRRIFDLKRGDALLDLEDGLGDWRPESGYYTQPRSSFVGAKEANVTKLLGLIRRFYQGADVSGTVLGSVLAPPGTRFNPRRRHV